MKRPRSPSDDTSEPDSAKAKGRGRSEPDERAERLKSALKANIGRRKAMLRARADQATDPSAPSSSASDDTPAQTPDGAPASSSNKKE